MSGNGFQPITTAQGNFSNFIYNPANEGSYLSKKERGKGGNIDWQGGKLKSFYGMTNLGGMLQTVFATPKQVAEFNKSGKFVDFKGNQIDSTA